MKSIQYLIAIMFAVFAGSFNNTLLSMPKKVKRSVIKVEQKIKAEQEVVKRNIMQAAQEEILDNAQTKFVLEKAQQAWGKTAGLKKYLRKAKEFVAEQMTDEHFPQLNPQVNKEEGKRIRNARANNRTAQTITEDDYSLPNVFNEPESTAQQPTKNQPIKPEKKPQQPRSSNPPQEPNENPKKLQTSFYKNPWVYVAAMTAIPVIYATYNIINMVKDPVALRNHVLYLQILTAAAQQKNKTLLQQQLDEFADEMTVIDAETMAQLQEYIEHAQFDKFITLAQETKEKIAAIVAPVTAKFSKDAVVKILKRLQLGFVDELQVVRVWVAKKAAAAKNAETI